MFQRKWRFRFVTPYNIGAFESYLSDMAQRGFYLSKVTAFTYRFEKQDPSNMEYRVEFSEEALSQERLNFYEENGWHFVAHFQSVFVYCCDAKKMTCELHTDSAEQSLSLTNSIKGLSHFIHMSLFWLLALLIIVFLLPAIFCMSSLFLYFLEHILSYIIFFVMIVVAIMSTFFNQIQLSGIKKCWP